MAQPDLSYQFVDGLVSKIKVKLTGCEGTFEELLSKTRFQEACLRDVTSKAHIPPISVAHLPNSTTPVLVNNRRNGRNKMWMATNKTDLKCYTCKGTGHFARDCPLKGRGLPLESRGKKTNNKPQSGQGQKAEVKMRTDGEQDTELTGRSQSVVEKAVKQVVGTMHNIKLSGHCSWTYTYEPSHTRLCTRASSVRHRIPR